MPLSREQVIAALRVKGPAVPAELTSTLKENTIIVGAFLSELISAKEVLVTTAKMGGSPLYYLPEHKARIVRVRPYLNEKDRIGFDMLSQNKVLRDDTLTPLLRVNMRELKDFSLPVKVHYQGQEILFWRWFLTTQEEAQTLIQNSLGVQKPQEKQEIQTPKEQIEQKTEQKQTQPQTEQKEQVAVKQTKQDEKKQEQTITEKAIPQKNITIQKELVSQKQTLPKLDTNIKDTLLQTLTIYAQKNNIEIQTCAIVKANSELECTMNIPSAVGKIKYFAKVKKKKSCNDGDLAAALIKGQQMNLPTLFITTGNITKKAKTMLAHEYAMITVIENIGE